MSYKIRLHLERVENGQYVATSPDVPGLVAQGRSIRETTEIAEDVAKKIIESYLENGEDLPDSLVDLENQLVLDLSVAI